MLTEREVTDCLKGNLRAAASDAAMIAAQPVSGFYFDRMRKSLALCEGACRQMAVMRDDTRWLIPGMQFEEVHQRARAWLHHPSVQSKKLFKLLEQTLRMMLQQVEALQTKATGRSGLILPPMQRAPHRDARPVQVSRPAGLIVPPSVH